MSVEYSKAKSTKLTIKGEKRKKIKRKIKTVKDKQEKCLDVEDTQKHGGWWSISKQEDIIGSIAIEFGNSIYIKSLDDGSHIIGAPHNDGDGPQPEEIFTPLKIADDKLAIKSGYGKYLGISKNGQLIGRSDAIGQQEQFELIFQDGKLAILGYNNCFLSIDPETDCIVANKRKATESEFVKLRCHTEKEEINKSDTRPEEERTESDRQIEVNYVKKFQKFQDKRMKLNENDREDIKKARTDGNLHEILLDRRSKMKADRYCK